MDGITGIEIHFHLWMAIGVAMAALMIILGKAQYRQQTHRDIVRVFEDKPLGIVAIIMGLLFGLFLLVESGNEIAANLLVRQSASEDSILSVFGAGFICLCLGAFFALALYWAGHASALAKVGRLHLQRRQYRSGSSAMEQMWYASEYDADAVRRKQARQRRAARYGVNPPRQRTRDAHKRVVAHRAEQSTRKPRPRK